MARKSRYKSLWAEMTRQDISTYDLAEMLGKSPSTINSRLSGHATWTLKDAYKVLDLLEISHDKLHVFFPPNGVAEQLEKTPDPSIKDELQYHVNGIMQVSQKLWMEVGQ